MVFGIALFAGMLGFSGCGSSSSSTPSTPANVTVTLSGGGQVRLGSTAQFTAAVANATDTSVTWQVNGVVGGSSTTGTISTTGLYTPPAIIPATNTMTITAVSNASPTISATTNEVVLNPIPLVSTAVATQSPTVATSYLLDVIGTGFVAGSQLQMGATNVTTTFVSSVELQGTVTLATGTTSVAVDVVNPSPGGSTSTVATAQVQNLKATVAAAARLLDQATFGPTLTDIQHVQTVGLPAYLAEQFATPATIEPDITNPPPAACVNSTIPCQQSEWWQAVTTGQDQLRQRVALALSEMFVISTNSVNARAVTAYQNMLVRDAFANFSKILNDVTLSPGMGAYLDMLNSAKPAVIGGVAQIANENYAREVMQLFSTGINVLNPDGTVQLDGNGQPTLVYTEAQVQAFARAYTGWTYATATGTSPLTYPNNTPNFDAPMASFQAQHDQLAKVLLNGTTLPAGQTAEQDLAGALANLVAHPNVGPFVCKQLIQHMVTSNPSPLYVGRVAAVFANDGTGVRGNMQAVVQAMLTDPEARAGDTNATFDGGHLRESLLYLTNVIRALGFTNTDANGYYSSLSGYSAPLGEKPYTSGSVFNFFAPEYVIPGTTTNAPEFGQENTATAVLRLTLADNLVNNRISGFNVDLSATSALGLMASKTGVALTDSGNLVDALNTIFMHGQMPTAMRTAIVNHVATIVGNTPLRVRVATYLVISSSFYKVEH